MSAGEEARAAADVAGVFAAGGGVGEAFGAALEAHREHLTRLAERGLRRDIASKVAAADVVQETFMAAHRDAPTFRGRTPAELRAWLERILERRLFNANRHYRGTGRRRLSREVPLPVVAGGDSQTGSPTQIEPAGSITTPSIRAMRNEREVALLRALAQLPEHYRLVVCWHHEEKLTFEQIADRLGTTPEAARKLWGRALLRLRDALGSDHDPR